MQQTASRPLIEIATMHEYRLNQQLHTPAAVLEDVAIHPSLTRAVSLEISSRSKKCPFRAALIWHAVH